MARLNINGKVQEIDVDPATPLLWALREQAGLTGTKYGCGIAQCGACTVHLNGAPVRSCVTPVSVPCPISDRAIRITTVSSGRMTTQAVISGEPSAARTTAGPNGMFKPSASPPPTAALLMRNVRRVIFGAWIMASPYALAAAWMASRTCWKVPQRQMFVIDASILASLGFGVFFSSAETAMIIPDWQ